VCVAQQHPLPACVQRTHRGTCLVTGVATGLHERKHHGGTNTNHTFVLRTTVTAGKTLGILVVQPADNKRKSSEPPTPTVPRFQPGNTNLGTHPFRFHGTKPLNTCFLGTPQLGVTDAGNAGEKGPSRTLPLTASVATSNRNRLTQQILTYRTLWKRGNHNTSSPKLHILHCCEYHRSPPASFSGG
jgi:hypothetical protein